MEGEAARSRSVWAIGGAGLITLLLGGCSAASEHDRSVAESCQVIAPSDSSSVEQGGDFGGLPAEKADGPIHKLPIPAEPTQQQLDDASAGPPTRLSAETFAALLNHAIKDQTSDSVGDGVLNRYCAFESDVPPAIVQTVKDARLLVGDRMAPRSRSWIRSSISSDQNHATVFLIEKIESPSLGVEGEGPYIFWGKTLIELTRVNEHWKLADLKIGGVSETAAFAEWVWRDVMDSGKGWRRFGVS